VQEECIKVKPTGVPMVHACNPSYSAGRDQEVPSQPRQIVLQTLSRKNPSQKRVDGVVQGVSPEFKPQDCKKKKKSVV
jgi:hypothetical protein